MFRDSALSILARRRLLQKNISLESDFLAHVSSDNGVPILAADDPKFQSLTEPSGHLFIMGSGPSICSLGPIEWAGISSATSIGFGPWPLHPFIPDYYAFSYTNGLEDYDRIMTEVMNRRDIVERAPGVLFLPTRSAVGVSALHSIPEVHRGNTRLYGRVTPISHSRTEIAREVGYLHGARKTPPYIALDSGSTVVRLVSLALNLGWKSIVLVGVDLNSVKYFWDLEPKHLVRNGFASVETGQRGVVHDTVDTLRRPLGLVSMLLVLAEIASRSLDAKIQFVSNSSLLEGFLSEFQFD